MCGITGYVGDRDCADVLIDALSKLEYRGYDSAGIAVFEHGTIKVEKCKGRLSNLVEKMARDGKPVGHCGIGHTRWATHGEPSDINSHPHGNKRVSIVHNGIIENYKQIKEFLIGEGYSFVSETDTETVAKLLDYYYDGNPLTTISKVIGEIKGSYALGILFRDFPDTLYAVRKDSPLIVGAGENENFIASDVPAIIHYTRNYYLLDTNDIAEVKKDSIRFFDVHGNEVFKEINTADWDVDAAEKGGYEHFMLKEIHEQPTAVKTTITPRIQNHMPDFTAEGFDKEKLKDYKNIYIVACGTAMHAGMVGKYVIEKLVRVPVVVDIASEFRYRDPLIGEGDLMIVISQSGETADTKAALEAEPLATAGGSNSSAALEDGTYTVDFNTDSTMFHVNEAKEGKAELTVKDGKMTAHITLPSKNIVNLFVGTAADAQKDGAKLLEPTTDTVEYSDGTSEEVYGFDVPVPAVDEDFDLALIGTKGKWYDHKVSVSNPEKKN